MDAADTIHLSAVNGQIVTEDLAEAVEFHQPEPKRREPTPCEVERMEWAAKAVTFDDFF